MFRCKDKSFRYKLQSWKCTEISITLCIVCASWTRKTFWLNTLRSLSQVRATIYTSTEYTCIETTSRVTELLDMLLLRTYLHGNMVQRFCEISEALIFKDYEQVLVEKLQSSSTFDSFSSLKWTTLNLFIETTNLCCRVFNRSSVSSVGRAHCWLQTGRSRVRFPGPDQYSGS